MSRTRWIGFLVIFAFTGLAACTRGCGQTQSEGNDVLNVDRGFQFPPGFPPDPGEAGRKTLEGIDSDHEGLRDDVQRWIYARFPNDERKRKALRQMSISLQLDLTPNLSDQELLNFARRSFKAIDCLSDLFGYMNNEMEYVRAKVINTSDRTDRYLQNDSKYDGMALGPLYPSDGTACE